MNRYCRGLVRMTAVLLITLPALAGRQEKDGSVLMVGHCYTPAEAIKALERMGKTHTDRASWETRRAAIRKGILNGARLDPLPTNRKPPKVIRHGKKQMPGYTVENIAIQTLPGFWLCGNLYLPDGYAPNPANNKDAAAKIRAAKLPGLPGVLCPHGHKKDKRYDKHVQSRCGAFARMGCAVFAYDMVGYAETNAIKHRTPNALRLQTWNSIRALDFLESLPRIDKKRLAVTGCSGGGTQSFLLAAIDDRLDLAMPVCQVSAHFYGGCVCESGLPIHVHGKIQTNNVEFAACFAPKPLLMVSNGKDWTRYTPTVEFPYVQRIYGYYNAKAKLTNAHFKNEGHDYGTSKRAAACRFIARHFKLNPKPILDDKGAFDESWYKHLKPSELRVFNDKHPRPKDELKDPAKLDKQLDALIKAN